LISLDLGAQSSTQSGSPNETTDDRPPTSVSRFPPPKAPDFVASRFSDLVCLSQVYGVGGGMIERPF
jgi:hypothetical protein